ncbi:MAG: UDP-N-acetylmuramoyl-L-alanyl-D-glutamate--2,6-diaminopimelate ligase [Clostridia bacterium]|nr:UDP-N-acetylmuramoyl-L-alanyl-D-glutamate--2,6-diaminopimelate ligase [Clostridia bacterium]
MQLNDVYTALSVPSAVCDIDAPIKKITSDVNGIDNSTVFVWLCGVGYDTDTLTERIISSSPMLVITDRDRTLPKSVRTIRVPSARRALAILCSAFCEVDYRSTAFIGVTGTNGKTSCATMIYEILKHAGIRVGFIGTGKIIYGGSVLTDTFYSMTTPPPEILYPAIRKMQQNGCEAVVMEVSSHALSQERVSPIPFSYSIFTNLSSEHLDYHINMEEYYKCKLALFEQSENGIFNADDEYSSRAMRESFDKCNATSVGILWDAEARVRSIVQDGLRGTEFVYQDDKRIFKVSLPLVGYYNVYNALMALKCTIDFGIRPCVAKEALQSLSSIDGRFEVIGSTPCVIIDYAHTPEAFENVLKTVKSIKKERQRVIVVFGAGGERDKTKRPKMAEICEKYTTHSIVTNDNERGEDKDSIIADICCGFSSTSVYKVLTPRSKAIREAILTARDDDIILLLGKGHERYNITREGYIPFDEREVVRKAMKERKEARDT